MRLIRELFPIGWLTIPTKFWGNMRFAESAEFRAQELQAALDYVQTVKCAGYVC